MLTFNLSEVSNDTLNLLDLVIVERHRFNEPFLNINGFDEKLKLVTYQMEKDFCKMICDDYDTMEELLESDELVLIFNYLIEEGLHYLCTDEVLENIKMFDSVISGLSYSITNELICIFEEVEV